MARGKHRPLPIFRGEGAVELPDSGEALRRKGCSFPGLVLSENQHRPGIEIHVFPPEAVATLPVVFRVGENLGATNPRICEDANQRTVSALHQCSIGSSRRSFIDELHDGFPLNCCPELLVRPVRTLLLWKRFGGSLGECWIAIKGPLPDTERETRRDDCEVSLCCGRYQFIVGYTLGQLEGVFVQYSGTRLGIVQLVQFVGLRSHPCFPAVEDRSRRARIGLASGSALGGKVAVDERSKVAVESRARLLSVGSAIEVLRECSLLMVVVF